MGVFSKRMNREGGIAGMLAGLTVTIVYIFLYKGVFFVPGTNLFADSAANWMFGIQPESFGAIGAAVNFATAYIVAGATKETPQEIKDLVESVRIPKGAGAAQDH